MPNVRYISPQQSHLVKIHNYSTNNCNLNNPSEWPIKKNCKSKNIIYKAQVTCRRWHKRVYRNDGDYFQRKIWKS
jgi:DNA primase large subunit